MWRKLIESKYFSDVRMIKRTLEKMADSSPHLSSYIRNLPNWLRI